MRTGFRPWLISNFPEKLFHPVASLPLTKNQSTISTIETGEDSEAESRYRGLLTPVPMKISRRKRVAHLSKDAGPLDFGFHFPAQEIHQNFDSLFGRQDLCDNSLQSDKGALDDLNLIAFRELINQLFDLRRTGWPRNCANAPSSMVG